MSQPQLAVLTVIAAALLGGVVVYGVLRLYV